MSQSMSVRQRLIAALTGQPPDRMPITLYGVYPYSVGDWRSKEPSYRPLLDFAREHADPFAWWDVESGLFYSQVPMSSKPWGEDGFVETVVHTPLGPISCIINDTLATQWIKKYYLQDDEDVRRFLSLPYQPVRPDLGPVLELERMVGDRALTYHSVLDALGIVADLFTPEEFAIRCLTDTLTVKRMIDKVFEQLHDYLHYLLHHGPRSLYMIGGPELATPPLLSPRYFDEFVIPYDSQLIDMIHRHGSWAAIHCHGRLDAVLKRIADMGPDGLHPIEAPPMGDMRLAEAKRRIGDRVCLIGNVQIGDVIGLDKPEIDRAVRDAVQDGAPGGRFILSLTASPYEEVLSQRTLGNYIQIVESGRRYSAEL